MFNGVGMRSTTLVAESLLLKLALTATMYDTWLVPISVTVGATRKGSFTLDVDRYLGEHVSKQNVKVLKRSALHQFKLAIRWYKANGTG